MDFLLEEEEGVESLGFEFAVGWGLVELHRLAVRGAVVELEAYDGRAGGDFIEELLVMVQMPPSLCLVVLHSDAC